MSEMTCQNFHHVGQIFPFPAGWADATGAVQCLDGIAYRNGVGYSAAGVRASVARKQSLLSALELGILRGLGIRIPKSVVVDEGYDFSAYAAGLSPALSTPAGRAALVNLRREIPTGLLQALGGILAYMKSVATHSFFDFYPPGNTTLSSLYDLLNADFTLYSDQAAIESLKECFSVYGEEVGYAGFEDFTTWPVLEHGRPGPARLLLWTAIDGFLAHAFDIPGSIRSYLGQRSPWGSSNDESVLMTDLRAATQFGAQPPPGLNDIHPRRLASLIQSLYEHALSRIASQEVLMRDYALIPRYAAVIHATLTILVDYSPNDNPQDPGGATSPSFTIVAKDLEASSEAITAEKTLEYEFDIQYDRGVELSAIADDFVCDASIVHADFTGRGTTNTSDGVTWRELSTSDLIDVAMLSPSAYEPHWLKRGSAGYFGRVIQLNCIFKYKTPFENRGNGHAIYTNPQLTTQDCLPCDALSWLTASLAYQSFLAKGSVNSENLYLGDDDFMASAGSSDGDLLASVQRLMAKVNHGLSCGERWFEQGGIELGWLARQFTIESDSSIIRQLSGLPAGYSVVDVYPRYRIPISESSGHGLQALHDPTNNLWGDAAYTEDGKLRLLAETFGVSGTEIDWLHMPAWISQNVQLNNPALSAQAELLGVASYEAVPYDTAQQTDD